MKTTTKTKTLALAAAVALAAPGIASAQAAAAWYPIGYHPALGTISIDLVNYEERFALRGFWIKFEHHNGNATVMNYSMSCYAKTAVVVATVAYNWQGIPTVAELEQGQQYPVTTALESQIMDYVCEGYVPPRTKQRTQLRNVPSRF